MSRKMKFKLKLTTYSTKSNKKISKITFKKGSMDWKDLKAISIWNNLKSEQSQDKKFIKKNKNHSQSSNENNKQINNEHDPCQNKRWSDSEMQRSLKKNLLNQKEPKAQILPMI